MSKSSFLISEEEFLGVIAILKTNYGLDDFEKETVRLWYQITLDMGLSLDVLMICIKRIFIKHPKWFQKGTSFVGVLSEVLEDVRADMRSGAIEIPVNKRMAIIPVPRSLVGRK